MKHMGGTSAASPPFRRSRITKRESVAQTDSERSALSNGTICGGWRDLTTADFPCAEADQSASMVRWLENGPGPTIATKSSPDSSLASTVRIVVDRARRARTRRGLSSSSASRRSERRLHRSGSGEQHNEALVVMLRGWPATQYGGTRMTAHRHLRPGSWSTRDNPSGTSLLALPFGHDR